MKRCTCGLGAPRSHMPMCPAFRPAARYSGERYAATVPGSTVTFGAGRTSIATGCYHTPKRGPNE